MAYQFGMATMKYGDEQIGCLQNVTVDMNYDIAELFCGSSLYAADVRTHTGRITGNAEFAELNSITIQKLIGGTRTGDAVAVNAHDYPGTFTMVIQLTTDGIGFTLTFPKVRSSKLSLAFARDSHVIPDFDFQVQADTDGSVLVIDLGDIS